MSGLTLDIETVPREDALDAPYPEDQRNPPGNYKLPEAVAKWREADGALWRKERVKECSVNPRLGRVLCIGLAVDDGPVGVHYAATEAEEASILAHFWHDVSAANGRVITWNGGWDLRFLVIRSLALGVPPTLPANMVRDWFRRYVVRPHFDCKAVLLNWEARVSGEGLEEWAAFFGLDGKQGMSGGDVYPAFVNGEHQKIQDYCAGDVTATRNIYQRIAPMFG